MARSTAVPFVMALVVGLGTLNNFTGRIKAETLGKYSGAVSGVVDTVVYVFFYLILAAFQGPVARKQLPMILRRGRTWESTGIWKWLVIAGLSDQIGSVFGFLAQPYLTALMYSLMNQAIVPFTVVLSMVMLRSRYIALEVSAVCVVAAAAIACVISSNAAGGQNDMAMAVLTATTTCFPAGGYVLKELAFRDWANLYREDIELGLEEPANAVLVGLVCGVTGLFMSLPVVLMIQSSQSSDPVGTLCEGFAVLWHAENALCAYAVYIVVNLAFNFALLLLVGYGSALLAFLSLKLAVPFVALLSPLPWPIIGPSPVTPEQWLVLVVMIGGVVAFRCGNQMNQALCDDSLRCDDQDICCWPICGRRAAEPLKQKLHKFEPSLPPSFMPMLSRKQSAPAGTMERTEPFLEQAQIPLVRSASSPASLMKTKALTAPILERGLSFAVPN
eukprot:TRINITY_DN21956_c0_g1_i1.p1 TRINITY_DN21956_c0_g1~~TRINITY_DN21956_c0_g1_i1.p1  ORF type:complete len:445 (+),score=46.75 TRINITY_DN21956_c0_g1_i1:118-1452(+)